jgi:predicted amidohydrolase
VGGTKEKGALRNASPHMPPRRPAAQGCPPAQRKHDVRTNKKIKLLPVQSIARLAAQEGSQVIAFHECSVTGYTFARRLSKTQMLDLAELIPQGESVARLVEIAQATQMVILAGLFEKDENDHLFKAYVCVDKNGLLAKYRKLHPFINPHLTPGDRYCIFEIRGWKCGILICYTLNGSNINI